MANYEFSFVQDLRKPITVRHLPSMLFTDDNLSVKLSVQVRDNGEDVNIEDHAIEGTVLLPNGATEPIRTNVSVEGNVASMVLTSGALCLPGRISAVLRGSKIVDGNTVTTTLLAVNATIIKTSSDTIYDPDMEVPNIDQLLALINACEDATEDAIGAAQHAVRYDEPQTLTSGQKTQARMNIGVTTASVREHTLVIAEASAADAEVVEVVTGETPVIEAVKNHRYICEDDLTSLSFTPCESGLCEVVFHSSSDDILAVTGAVMPDWRTATEAGYTYEMSFADGFGAVMIWTTPS